MSYNEALELSLKVKWNVSFCPQGQSCWCRCIVPETPIFDDEGNEIYIVPSGTIHKIHAEYIIDLHNKQII